MPEWIIFVTFCVIVWGLWGFVGRLTMSRGMTYWSFGAISSCGLALTALILMLFFSHFHSQRVVSISLALLSGFFEGAGSIVLYRALASGPASIIMPLFALYPAVTFGLSYIFLKERLSPMQAAGICLTLAAAILLGSDKSNSPSAAREANFSDK